MQRQRRRAILQSRRVEAVSLTALRLRDSDTCQICGKAVDPAARPPHPDAATIDHIVALAHGGVHSFANTQLAHHRCNNLKGDGPAAKEPSMGVLSGDGQGPMIT